jgi:hypothetical protein
MNENRNVINNRINGTDFREPNNDGYIFEDEMPILVDNILQIQPVDEQFEW